MKKVLGALLIGVLALAVSAHAVTPGKIVLGIDTAGGNLGRANCAATIVSYNITDSISAGVGLNYSNDKNAAGTENSQTGISARVNYYLPMTLASASPYVGLQYSSDGASTATSIVSLLIGGQSELADGVILGAGLIPYSSSDMSGTTDTSLNTGTGNLTGRNIFMSLGVELN
jgi:hypothetical protein